MGEILYLAVRWHADHSIKPLAICPTVDEAKRVCQKNHNEIMEFHPSDLEWFECVKAPAPLYQAEALSRTIEMYEVHGVPVKRDGG